MTPFGDRALRFAIPPAAPRRRLFEALTALPGVVDVILTEEMGCVVVTDDADRSLLEHTVAHASNAREDTPGKKHVVDVVYDGEDLEAVASAIGRTLEDVIALHAERDYRVSMLGFLPGFAYLRGLPEELHLPRRAPRPRVPAASIGIASGYTGIYPFASPGGWHLLGRAVGFAPFGEQGAVFAIGDTVRFTPSSARETKADAPAGSAPAAPSGPHLEVTRVAGLALLVDGGRPGRMHEGIPPGGPIVGSLFRRANALARNTPSACAVELAGAIELTARGGPIVIADDEARLVLAEGDRHLVSTGGRTRVRYLALGGGIDAPMRLGGRGALLVAGIGRPLRRGDRLLPRGEPEADPWRDHRLDLGDGPIGIFPGPDVVDGFSLDALASADLRIAPSSDRTGTRLDGPRFHVGAGALARPSAPMVMGAIELTPSGLIVLGPDHPTTGGYPVVAVVRSGDRGLDALFSRPLGAAVRFIAEPSA